MRAGVQVQACVSTQIFYALMLTLGGSSVGLFAAINTMLFSFAIPSSQASDECEDMLVH